MGSARTRRKLIYFSDPDVVLLSDDFLERAMAELGPDGDGCLVEPRMIHLTECGQAEFCADMASGQWAPRAESADELPWLCDYRDGRLVPAAEGIELKEEGGVLFVASPARLSCPAGQGREGGGRLALAADG